MTQDSYSYTEYFEQKVLTKRPYLRKPSTTASLIGDSKNENRIFPRHRLSLYIDLSSNSSVDSREVSDGVVADFDESGNLVGIDIDQAKTKLDLRELDLQKIPFDSEKITA